MKTKKIPLKIFKTGFFKILIFFVACPFPSIIFAQPLNDTIIFNPLGDFKFNFTYSGYTPLFDRLGRPFVYLAAKELGLVTFDISNTSNPLPVDTLTVSSLGNLKVTGVTQESNFLFLSLGDFQGTGQNAGLAIFDISNPLAPVLLDRWDSIAFNKGTATVILQGNYAYLGAMASGVLILDISNMQNIRFISRVIPDTSFGNNSYDYHSRGLFLSGDTLLVSNDNGGLRVIDVTDKENPIEVGKYLSDSISSEAYPFYNHIYRIGDYAFCALDYCGVEVVNVSDPSLMTEVSWMDPWNCSNLPAPFGTWNGSDGHTNEIAYSSADNILFFSGGDSEILALDPSNPDEPRIMGGWGPPNDSVGTWGIDIYGNLAALANTRTFGFPFISTVGGLQLLNWNRISGIEDNNGMDNFADIFPNPFSQITTINFTSSLPANFSLKIFDFTGRETLSFTSQQIEKRDDSIQFDGTKLQAGIYLLKIEANGFLHTKKILKL